MTNGSNVKTQAEVEEEEIAKIAKMAIPCPREVVDGVEHGRSAPVPMRRPTCACGEVGTRSERYDSYYCPKTGVWLETPMHDGCEDCHFCGERPARAF